MRNAGKNRGTSMNENRAAMRADAACRRDGIPATVRTELSRRIGARVIAWIEKHGTETVMLYLSMRSEVETDGLLEYLIIKGKTALVPLMDTPGKTLVPYRLTNPATELVRHPFGMQEPDPCLCRRFPPEAIHLICVPGLAFDRRGYRIGYGGGYYDRFLPTCPQAVWMGLAYEAQIVDDTRPQTGDVSLHRIVTEREL